MKCPNIISVRSVVEMVSTHQARVPPGVAWVPIRPAGPYAINSFTRRWKAAWLVFTGKADALTWDRQ